MKKILSILLVFIIAFMGSNSVFAGKHFVYWNTFREPVKKLPIKVKINGEIRESGDVEFLSKNNRIFVPLSFVQANFATSVSYDFKEQTADIDNGKIIIDTNTGEILLDGIPQPNDYPPFSTRNTIMIPIRTIGLAYNYKVIYNGYYNMVELNKE